MGQERETIGSEQIPKGRVRAWFKALPDEWWWVGFAERTLCLRKDPVMLVMNGGSDNNYIL